MLEAINIVFPNFKLGNEKRENSQLRTLSVCLGLHMLWREAKRRRKKNHNRRKHIPASQGFKSSQMKAKMAILSDARKRQIGL